MSNNTSSSQLLLLLPKKCELFINGEFKPSKINSKFCLTNPINEEILTFVSEGEKEDVDDAVKAAELALEDWNSNYQRRRNLLLKFADLWDEKVLCIKYHHHHHPRPYL